MKSKGKLIGLLLALGWANFVHAEEVTYVYTDTQGTPVMESDAQGNITARYDYRPYGAPVASMNTPSDGPGYTGHVSDADTGLVYMQARYYDPVIGRFLSADPVEPPMGGRYSYANGNPLAFIDPDGREADESDENKQPGDASPSCKTAACNQQRQQERNWRNNQVFTGGGVTSTVNIVNQYGHYKFPPQWTFKMIEKYRYLGRNEFSSKNKLDDPFLREIRAKSNVARHETILFMGAFDGINTPLYYKNLQDITPIELRMFNYGGRDALIFVLEHEAVHINLGSGDDAAGEGEANFWAEKAVRSYHDGGN